MGGTNGVETRSTISEPAVNEDGASAPRLSETIEVFFEPRSSPADWLQHCFREEYAIWRNRVNGPIFGRSNAGNKAASCDKSIPPSSA